MHNALLVRWSGGWAEVHDDTSIAAHGRCEALLGIGAAQSLAEVERVSREQLAIYADARTEITAALVPVDDTDTPFVAFSLSDTVLVPGIDGTATRERVLALTVAEDEHGTVTFAPELRDVVLTDQERWERNLKKMVDGSVGGQSVVAQPAAQIASAGGGAATAPTGFEAAFTLPGALTAQYSPPITTPINCTLKAVVVTVRTVAATFKVIVYADGVEAFNETVAADAELTVFTASGTSSADTTLWVIKVQDCSVSTADVAVVLRFG